MDWGIREPDYDPSEEYGGTEPFSEPEVMCTKSLAQNRRPHVYVNVHSGMDGLLVPWDHKPFIVKGHERTDRLLGRVSERFCAGKCIHGAGSATVGCVRGARAGGAAAPRPGRGRRPRLTPRPVRARAPRPTEGTRRTARWATT